MLNNINMEFIQALNPLYAIPIVAVIFCAFIVYAFGFKSSVPPPSFDGIEEEKKINKKKRAKENPKVNKVIQNGKMNGSTIKSSNKTSKKGASEKGALVEKPAIVEKTNTADKKVAQANKKNKSHSEKKAPQGKKIESVSQEESNDDGWVQLVSKKGRKNRKKDDANSVEVQPATESLSKDEPSKLNDVFLVDDSPKLDLQKETVEQKQSSPVSTTKASKVKEITNTEKSKKQDVQFPKPDDQVEKQPLTEPKPKESKVLEESNKSKKKKKKNLESNQNESESVGRITSTSEPPVVKKKEIVDISNSQGNLVSNSNVTEIQQSIGKGDVDQPSEAKSSNEVKSSNVAFDELAGLYPETKEQKKKKKVRRD